MLNALFLYYLIFYSLYKSVEDHWPYFAMFTNSYPYIEVMRVLRSECEPDRTREFIGERPHKTRP